MAFKYTGEIQASVKRDGGVGMSKFHQILKQSPEESVIDVPENAQDEEAVKSIPSIPFTNQPLGTLSVLSPNISHSQSDSVPIIAAPGKLDCNNGQILQQLRLLLIQLIGCLHLNVT